MLSVVILALLGAATIYSLLVILAALAFGRRRPDRDFTPPVSILKPLYGADPHLYECLASFCRQDYPEYELLCCTADPNDPAVGIVWQLQKDFPQRGVRLLTTDKVYGANPKIDSLDRMYREMQHEFLVASDDDIVVGPDYLRSVMSEFADEKVGFVTCPYRGRPRKSVASIFEAIGISGEFFCGVLMARMLEGITFGLGSTIATRKESVTAIGGFPAMADYLADDYELGNRIGRGVLSSYIVDTPLTDETWSGMLAHQMRWMRAQASSRPGGYFGLGITYGAVYALAALALGLYWPVAAWLAIRLIAAWTVGAVVLDDPSIRHYWWLIPFRELLTAVLWFASLFQRAITWRGRRFRTVGGKLIPIP